MRRVTGIGGVFFRANDQLQASGWYEKHLGIKPEWEHGASFKWREETAPDKKGMTIWSLFSRDTDYFGDSNQAYMLNYRVEKLDALLTELRAEGVWVDDKREDSEYGRFAWIKDCDGNRIELWEPPAE